MPTELLWRLLAFILARRPVADWIIRRAQRTPYLHLPGYMHRWWLFNPYDADTSLPDETRGKSKRWPRLPSVRVHHILRHDLADHHHDHPWNARTIILRGYYFEGREAGHMRIMTRGDTSPIRFGEFHHIHHVSDGGVFTLFFTWGYAGTWGFSVDGRKMPHREYLQRYPQPKEAGE